MRAGAFPLVAVVQRAGPSANNHIFTTRRASYRGIVLLQVRVEHIPAHQAGCSVSITVYYSVRQ